MKEIELDRGPKMLRLQRFYLNLNFYFIASHFYLSTAGRLKINSEFKKFKDESNPKKIEDVSIK